MHAYPSRAAPPANATWAAMGRSLGMSSNPAEDARLHSLLDRLQGRVLLMIGDSSLRNQFVQLTRIGLAFERTMPVAEAVSKHAHRGSFSTPYAIKQPERPDSSNGFWGGFPWMAFSTPRNTTIIYAKLWGCSDLRSIVHKMRSVASRHQQRSGMGGWPPHAVLWNFGLHLLHVYPARPVPTTSVACALGYESLVDSSARTLRAELARAHLTYRTTNAVCDARFEGPWATAQRAYHCASHEAFSSPGCRNERLARVQAACQRRYNLSLSDCANTFMDEANTRRQQQRARAVLRSHSARVSLMDAFQMTNEHCEATVDGRHYPRRLASLNAFWLEQELQTLGPLLAPTQ